jgi:hypothetical protein
MLKPSISCTRFEVTIVVVHVGAVKIYVVTVEALRKKERRVKTGWNAVWHKKWCISEFDPPWRLMYFCGGFFFNLTRFWTKLRVLMPCFPYFTENSTKHPENWCPYVVIPLKVIRKSSTDSLWRFQKAYSHLGENQQTGSQKRLSIYVKTLKVLTLKVRTAQH